MQIQNENVPVINEERVNKLADKAGVPVWLASMLDKVESDDEAMKLLDFIKSKKGTKVKNIDNPKDYQAIIEEIIGINNDVKLDYHKLYYTFRKLLSEYLQETVA